jgi:hypothetical protein
LDGLGSETFLTAESTFPLTKSESIAIAVLIDGIDPRLADSRARSEESWLFERLATTTSSHEFKRGEDFSIFIGRNPLKRPDSEK